MKHILAENYKRFFGEKLIEANSGIAGDGKPYEYWWDGEKWDEKKFQKIGLLGILQNFRGILYELESGHHRGRIIDDLVDQLRREINELSSILEDLS